MISAEFEKMKALVLPFPPARRSSFVKRHAAYIASLSPAAGIRHLSRQISIQQAAFERKGIPRELIDRESQSLEDAIRGELLKVCPAYGGAA